MTRHRMQAATLFSFAVAAVAVLSLTADAKDDAKTAQRAGNLAVITNWGSDSCSLVDVAGGNELAKIDVGLKLYDVKIDPKGRFAYVTCSGDGYIAIIDIQAMLEM